jgi:hypothetical protein
LLLLLLSAVKLAPLKQEICLTKGMGTKKSAVLGWLQALIGEKNFFANSHEILQAKKKVKAPFFQIEFYFALLFGNV